MSFKTIHILRSQFLNQYNIWAYKTVLESVIDITDFEHHSSAYYPKFIDNLVSLLPELKKDKCSTHREGHFLKRLQEGTWMGHILEHVVLTLQNLAGLDCSFGQTRTTQIKGIYFIVFATPHEIIGREALALGIQLILAVFNDEYFDLNAQVKRLRACILEHTPGPSTSVFLTAAKQQRLPFLQMHPPYNWYQFNYGKFSKCIWTSLTEQVSDISLSIAQDKELTKNLLSRFGIPTAEGNLYKNAYEALNQLNQMKRLTIKPVDANRSKGICLDVQTEQELLQAFQYAQVFSKQVMVERFYPGESYCINVVDEQVVGILQATQTQLIGDGHSSVTQLIDQLNEDSRRGMGDQCLYPSIEKDHSLELLLHQQHVDLTTILANQQTITVQKNIFNQTKAIHLFHPNILEQAILATQILKLDIAGVDLVVQDISQPLSQENGVILEVNAGPGHLHRLQQPAHGPALVNLGNILLDKIDTNTIRHPFLMANIVSTDDDEALLHLVRLFFTLQNIQTAAVGPQTIYFPDGQQNASELRFSEKNHLILKNKTLEAGILFVNHHHLLHEGLVARNHIVFILSINLAQLRYYPYKTPDNFAKKIFGTPVDALLTNGLCILNGDDPFIVSLAEFSDAPIVFLSQAERIDHLKPYLQGHTKILHYHHQQIHLIEQDGAKCLYASIHITTRNPLHTLAILALSFYSKWENSITLQEILTYHQAEEKYRYDHQKGKNIKSNQSLEIL